LYEWHCTADTFGTEALQLTGPAAPGSPSRSRHSCRPVLSDANLSSPVLLRPRSTSGPYSTA